MKQQIIVIVGATATGKSELAVELAKKIEAEIISADSMQLYKGMDIGTAKLTLAERSDIPHHLIDILEVSEDYSVAEYQSRSREICDQLLAQGRNVIVVGGTGLYIKAFLDELNFPDTDPEIRARLLAQGLQIGEDAMHQRLAILDPAAALAIPKENLRRVVRALEVIEITGKPFTANLPRVDSKDQPINVRYPNAKQFGLVMDRSNLQERIDLRVERMWSAGFVAEVAELMERGILAGKSAQRALGYAQIIKFLEGKVSEEAAMEETKRASRQYARRQETWFSRDSRIQWINQRSTDDRLATLISAI
jgi:tRNA dimethylallyltransferase